MTALPPILFDKTMVLWWRARGAMRSSTRVTFYCVDSCLALSFTNAPHYTISHAQRVSSINGCFWVWPFRQDEVVPSLVVRRCFFCDAEVVCKVQLDRYETGSYITVDTYMCMCVFQYYSMQPIWK